MALLRICEVGFTLFARAGLFAELDCQIETV
jgi:hypothetical protein